MAITDNKVHKDAKVALERLPVALITAVSLTDVLAFSYRPGHAFEIADVQAYCRTEAGVVTADVKIGTVSVLSAVLAFATGTRVDGTLAAALAARRGSKTDDINVHFTTDATGALTNGFVVVTIRPVPLNGEIATE